MSTKQLDVLENVAKKKNDCPTGLFKLRKEGQTSALKHARNGTRRVLE